MKKAYHPHGNVSSEYTKWIWETKVSSLWKSSNVLPIPKKNTAQVKDFRPISLTSTIIKILDCFVFKSVLEQILPHINRYQYGNTKKCSTTLALNHMTHLDSLPEAAISKQASLKPKDLFIKKSNSFYGKAMDIVKTLNCNGAIPDLDSLT
jgi:hypothetical protein